MIGNQVQVCFSSHLNFKLTVNLLLLKMMCYCFFCCDCGAHTRLYFVLQVKMLSLRWTSKEEELT